MKGGVMETLRAARASAIAAISGAGLLSSLVSQPASATPVIECPGVRYVYTSSVNFPDPANTGSTCTTAYDGGTVAADGTFNAVTAFGGLGWTVTASTFGQLLRITNNFGITWNLGPLPGSLAAISDPAANVTRYAYDSLGRVQTTTAPGSQTTQYAYDGSSNRIQTTTAPGGNITTYTYDAGWPNTVTESSGSGHQITYTYDSGSNRPASAVESPGGHTMTYSYDSNRLATRLDSAGPTTTYTYDGG